MWLSLSLSSWHAHHLGSYVWHVCPRVWEGYLRAGTSDKHMESSLGTIPPFDLHHYKYWIKNWMEKQNILPPKRSRMVSWQTKTWRHKRHTSGNIYISHTYIYICYLLINWDCCRVITEKLHNLPILHYIPTLYNYILQLLHIYTQVLPDEKPYDRRTPWWLNIYVVVHFAVILILSHELGKVKNTLPYFTLVMAAIFIFFSLTNFGLMYDCRYIPKHQPFTHSACVFFI